MLKKALLFGLAVVACPADVCTGSGRAADSGFIRTFSRG